MTESLKDRSAMPGTPPLDALGRGYISSERIAGTPLYGPRGDHIGTIDRLLIDPESGGIAFAMVRFGSLMGLGGDREPVPWSDLRFDIDVGGQVYDADTAEARIAAAGDAGVTSAGRSAAPAAGGGPRRLRDAPAEQA